MNRIGSKQAVERLTALWALNEAGLGGLMHAVKSPFAGIVVGGTAIILIALIAWFAEKRMPAIFKALVIVLIIKAAVSPHSPVTAYVAVGFQALAGAILFTLIPNFRITAIVLGFLGVMESAVQKIIFLTILYGKSLWEAVDLFFMQLARQFGFDLMATGHGASFWLIAAYLGFHGLAGLCIGWIAGTLPKLIEEALRSDQPHHSASISDVLENSKKQNKKSKAGIKRLARYLVTISIVAAVLTFLAPVAHGPARGLLIIFRTIAIILVWYFLVAPLLMKGLRRLLKKQEAGYGKEIENILSLLPHLKNQVTGYWPATGNLKGLARVRQFIVGVIVFALTFEAPIQETDKLQKSPV